jgi:Centromere-binding protein ParB C-terminal
MTLSQEPAGSVPGEPPVRPRRNRTSPDRVQRSFYLSRDLVDRARAAVSATMQRPGEAYNVSQLAGRGLEAEVRRLETMYNGGQPFPPVHHVPSGPSPEGVERIRAGVASQRRARLRAEPT